MLEVHRALVLVACVSTGFVISAGPGLVARAAEPERWVDAIAATASTAATPDDAAQRRIAELEQRIAELEAERRALAAAKPAGFAAGVARDEELAARHLAQPIDKRELGQSRTSDASALHSADQQPSSGADAREQLRYWAKQIRDGEADSRRLSPEATAAVNVLLRRERELDPHNPWREP